MIPSDTKKFSVLPAAFTLARTLVVGVARFYACLILFNVMVWLPVHIPIYVQMQTTYGLFEQIFLRPTILYRATIGLDLPISFSALWEALLAPVLLMIVGILALRKRRMQILGAYFVLLSNFCLASLVIGLILKGLFLVFQICLLLSLLLLIATSTFWAFHYLFTRTGSTWIAGMAGFASNYLLPSAIVTLFTAMNLSLFLSPQWRWYWVVFELWGWTYVPIISIAAIAAFYATIK